MLFLYSIYMQPFQHSPISPKDSYQKKNYKKSVLNTYICTILFNFSLLLLFLCVFSLCQSTGKTDQSDEDDDDDVLDEENIEHEKGVSKTVTLELIKQWRTGLEVRYLTSICTVHHHKITTVSYVYHLKRIFI